MKLRFTAILLLSFLTTSTLVAQTNDQKKEQNKEQIKEQKKAQDTAMNAVLWEKVDVATVDLKAGPGGSDVPDVSTVTFVEEEKGGYSKEVQDQRRRRPGLDRKGQRRSPVRNRSGSADACHRLQNGH